MIYFDNAATSNSKSEKIPEAVSEYLKQIVCSPGRGSHRYGQLAAEKLETGRSLLKELFHAEHPKQFHFCFNATHGLNLVIQGVLQYGDHVVTTALEHNSVLRPLRKMSEEKNIAVTIVPSNKYGALDPQKIIDSIRPNTRLVVLNHASNVFGTVLQLKPILEHCLKHGVKTLVDASQTAGLIEIDLSDLPATYMVATGHKALNGPSGTGIIYARTTDAINPLLVGGTGGNSASMWHPQNNESIFEAGTPNFLGIAGLISALAELRHKSLSRRRDEFATELQLAKELYFRLKNTKHISVYGDDSGWNEIENPTRLPLFIFNIQHMTPQQAVHILDDNYDIILRGGLHCAPIAHMMAGTLPNGALRISLGPRNTSEEVDQFLEAIKEIVAENFDQGIMKAAYA